MLHVLLTGETEGYYEGFADDPTQRLARCLAEGFVYQGETPPGEGAHPRGKPSAHLPATRFVSFLQNHDQVGNRAMGERLIHLTDQAKLRAATALLLLCPQIPLLFMGEEEGSRSPFLFFTDFHDELADAVREGRRREFARFAAFADPAARETHSRSQRPLRPSTPRAPKPGPDAAEWRAFYRELLALRHERIVPRLLGAQGQGRGGAGRGRGQRKLAHGRWRALTIAVNLGECAGAISPTAASRSSRSGSRASRPVSRRGRHEPRAAPIWPARPGCRSTGRTPPAGAQRVSDDSLRAVLAALGLSGRQRGAASRHSLERCEQDAADCRFVSARCGAGDRPARSWTDAGAAQIVLESGETLHCARINGTSLPAAAPDRLSPAGRGSSAR